MSYCWGSPRSVRLQDEKPEGWIISFALQVQCRYSFAPADIGPDTSQVLKPIASITLLLPTVLVLQFDVVPTPHQLEQKRSTHHFPLNKHKGGKQLRSVIVSYSSTALINFSKAKSNALVYESYKVRLLQAMKCRSQSFCSRQPLFGLKVSPPMTAPAICVQSTHDRRSSHKAYSICFPKGRNRQPKMFSFSAITVSCTPKRVPKCIAWALLPRLPGHFVSVLIQL